MCSFKLTPNEYQLYVNKFSKRKHLILEGKRDKQIFLNLIDEFIEINNNNLNRKENIDIDSLEEIVKKKDEFNDMTENIAGTRTRERLKIIYRNTKNSDNPNHSNLVFFIDREFDFFIIDESLDVQDTLNEHKVENNLVWSIGHSIENYLFTCDVLKKAFKSLTNYYCVSEVIHLFDKVFKATMCIACTISIVLYHEHKIQDLEKHFNAQMFSISSSGIEFKLDAWKQHICSLKKVTDQKAEELIMEYKKWFSKLDNKDMTILQRACHGHIGVKIILEVYYQCLSYCLKQTGSSEKIAKDGKLSEDAIVHLISTHWASGVVTNRYSYPKEIFKMLGFEEKTE